ncbi:hypothetical protein QYE76_001289 [Lolium multiflorum]|uniref:Reverse transcriptase domain-containing protein n=1 Tax=Lolium multiflorum TaxID=4521 RepID=A0AAD8VYF7_LOLMU|nr:hypothetical protein QYE76_001289 [Lolium multiflorum]
MICGLLGTTSTQVVVNGMADGLIFNHRGLWKGDPLSPLLFGTIMGVLHLLFERTVTDGLLTKLAASGFRHRTSIYADKVVTLIRPTKGDLLTCASTVDDFGVTSGLRTNLAKCSIHPIRCMSEQVDLARPVARGAKVEDIAPYVVTLVSKRRANACLIKGGLAGGWLKHCGPNLEDKKQRIRFSRELPPSIRRHSVTRRPSSSSSSPQLAPFPPQDARQGVRSGPRARRSEPQIDGEATAARLGASSFYPTSLNIRRHPPPFSTLLTDGLPLPSR